MTSIKIKGLKNYFFWKHKFKSDKKIKNKIENHKIWSPDSPNLYEFQIKLQKANISKNDTVYFELDNIKETFGFREFTVKNNKFYLNDKPLYLKAAFEGLYPVKLSYPDSKEMMIKEILLAKDGI